MPKLTSVAVDTNVLFDLVQEVEVVIDCLETIVKHIPNRSIVVLPLVIVILFGPPPSIRRRNQALRLDG
jgi:hypothetical protein